MSDVDIQWYGYLHVDETLHVKRYFDRKDIEEAQYSDFVQRVTSPFFAINRTRAFEIAKSKLTS